MKVIFQMACLLFSALLFSKNIQVDGDTFTPQQLVEDILINSTCIENIEVTNVVGGNFGTSDKSYGYFSSNGSSFPLQNGIVLSTGKINNTQGPNNSLSDDDGSNWVGDNDLESILNEQNTINATVLEFNFTSIASQISFRYIFASEEYQEGNSNTCQYSDLFGFLIRPVGEQQYTNIAVVPNTETPVKVTTVHPEIPGGCQAVNELYFESFNGSASPINFNGQTKVLTATANIIPNQVYHVKLVIADEQNYRYDSAVFLEAGSFQISSDLGPDRLISTDNALCKDEIYELDATQATATNYKWLKDGNELVGETNPTLSVSSPGTYQVEVTLTTDCISYGQIVIEYFSELVVADAELIECDQNQDGLTYYDLFDATSNLTLNNNSEFVSNYFLTESDAIQNINPISNPGSFQNSVPSQIVYARIEIQAGCFATAQLQLNISTNNVSIPNQNVCDTDEIDGFSVFNLNDISETFQDQIPGDAVVNYFETEQDAFDNVDNLSSPYQNSQINSQLLYVKISSNNQCYAITTVSINVNDTPVLMENETDHYCLDSFPETHRIFGGVLNDSPSNYYYEWLFNGNSTAIDTSFFDLNETGIYTVIVTDPSGCSATRTITILPSGMAIVESVQIQQGSANNSVSVQISGLGSYEFALDDSNGNYQESNVFTNVIPGFHTIYVRDTNGCGIAKKEISVLGFPKYFTPNGDNIHDTWQAFGVNSQFNTDIEIKIFDRFGKFLSIQKDFNSGWDGTSNGDELPCDDYWFLATLKNGQVFRGHFSLIR